MTGAKGVLLAGGAGSRLAPATLAMSKHLIPVYDKPMIYYPMSMLMLAGLRDILIISGPDDLPALRKLFGSGAQFGLRLSYAEQSSPRGIADALLVAAEYLAGTPVMLVLGDNLFYGDRLPEHLQRCINDSHGATIFTHHVADPHRFGVAEYGPGAKVISVEEKPAQPRSQWAITGCYFFDGLAPALAQSLSPSSRGELEITDLVKVYLERGELKAVQLGRGFAWLDMGTADALLEASQFVLAIERRQGLKIACLEEVALNMGYIGLADLHRSSERMGTSVYGDYLRSIGRRRS